MLSSANVPLKLVKNIRM